MAVQVRSLADSGQLRANRRPKIYGPHLTIDKVGHRSDSVIPDGGVQCLAPNVGNLLHVSLLIQEDSCHPGLTVGFGVFVSNYTWHPIIDWLFYCGVC